MGGERWIVCKDNAEEDIKIYEDKQPRWTFGLERHIYLERKPRCPMCAANNRPMPRFVPTDPGIESLTPQSLRSFIKGYGNQIPEVRKILLDHWPSSNNERRKRKPRSVRRNVKHSPSTDAAMQDNDDDEVHTTTTLSATSPLLLSQIQDPVEAEKCLSDRPILATETASEKRHADEVLDCKQADNTSLSTDDSTVNCGEEDTASPIIGKSQIKTSKPKSRRVPRDLSQVNVDDMDTETRRDRLRTLRIMIERDGHLTGKNETQYAELMAKSTKTRRRDLSKMSVAEMDTQTKSKRRSVLRKKIQRGDTLRRSRQRIWAYKH